MGTTTKRKRPLKNRPDSTDLPKMCSSCGAQNEYAATACASCGKSRFEPEWVIAHRPINRQFSVQITHSNPEFGDVQRRITLSKWWPGGSTTFHFPNAEQWHEVEQIINHDLGPQVGWKPLEALVDAASRPATTEGNAKAALEKLTTEYPGLIRKLASAIDPEKLSRQDVRTLTETLEHISGALTTANAGFREAFLSVVSRLPTQKQRALEDLDLLLQGWSLSVITNVAQQVQARLETIELFQKQIQDARTFEIRGEHSIHRILERAMWLVDEHYWLLHSNKPLRVAIGDAMAKRDKELYGDRRPDFVCGTVGDRLIILELKRPAHALNVEDLNQLETYLTVAENHFSFNSSTAYLVGAKIDDELKRRLKYRSGFKVLFYADIIDATSKRYHAYLKSLDANIPAAAGRPQRTRLRIQGGL